MRRGRLQALGIEHWYDPWDKHRAMFSRAKFCAVMLTVTTGCQSLGGVNVTAVATASGKPSNVATVVMVTQDGQPVSTLGPGAFRLIENGQALENQSVELRLLDPAKVAAFHTVLLLDMSHASTDEDRQQFGEAAAFFIRSVRVRQSVTVLGFDGSAKTRLLGEFPVDVTGAGVDHVEKQLSKKLEPSRDLRGAVIQALELLDRRLEKSARPLRVGTLVVFSRGPDAAGRVPEYQFEMRLSQSPHKLVLVNVAGDPLDSQSALLSKDGRFQALAVESLPIAFEEAASTVEKLSNQYYLVSYCSPARARESRVRVEVQVVSDELQVDTGAVEASFDASGFTRGCNSSNPPQFTRAKAVGWGAASSSKD
jgi:hypothetical protein